MIINVYQTALKTADDVHPTAIMRELGFHINHNEVVGPSKKLDPIKITTSLPVEKLSDVKATLQSVWLSSEMTKPGLQSIVGKLNCLLHCLWSTLSQQCVLYPLAGGLALHSGAAYQPQGGIGSGYSGQGFGLWADKRIHVYCDNMALLHRVFWLSATYNLRIKAFYYPGAHNILDNLREPGVWPSPPAASIKKYLLWRTSLLTFPNQTLALFWIDKNTIS